MAKIYTTQKSIRLTKGSRLFVVMPHPDDETGFAAGFLKRMSVDGIDIFLLSLTHGEKSTLRFGLRDNDPLGDIRKRELQKAARVLGIKHVDIAYFPDGELSERKEEVSAYIMDTISYIRPQALLTLEPHGVYGHPDHIAVSEVVTNIYNAEKNFSLIYATEREISWIPDAWKKMAQYPITPLLPNMQVELSFKELLAKRSAVLAHKSQFAKDTAMQFSWKNISHLRKEYFYVVD